MVKCPECLFNCQCVNSLWLHLKVVHKAEKSQNFRCNEINCYRVCKSWKWFRQHLLTRHYGNTVSLQDACQVRDQTSAPESPCFDEMETDEPLPDDSQSAGVPVQVQSEKEFFQVILMFILKLYANHQLPRCHVQDVLHSVKSLCTDMVNAVKVPIQDKLRDSGVNDTTIAEICNTFDSFLKPFESFSSEYRCFKIFEEQGCFIPFETYIVGDRVDDKVVQGSIVKETVAVEAQYLPMRAVLKKLFSMPNVLPMVKNYMQYLLNENEVLENFVQGKLWRSKVEKFFKDKFVIPLFIFFDDFEINNVLGSHTGVQKLGALYYSVACFPPELNSLLENVFLSGLFHTYDRMTFKNHRIFHKIVDELNILQTEGIVIDGCEERVYFALGLLLGDNLGLNSILGFVESFNSHFYCRLCKLSKQEIQFTFHEQKLRLESYAEDILINDFRLTGIKEKSVWDRVLYFCSVLNFAVDILHDGHEGWGKDILINVLIFFVKKLEEKDQRLSLNVLNGRLGSFNYHHNAISNKPPPVSDKEIDNGTLKMSGTEMQNFIWIFSMLVGDLVPKDHEVWRVYCLYRQIIDIIMCRKIRRSYATLLRGLVAETLELYKRMFPANNIKPKAHNFLHYATVIEQSGPPVHLSTSKFERKHKTKKQEANATTSRKNITQTLMIKEQLMLCNRFAVKKKGLAPCDDFGGDENCLNHVSECEDYVYFGPSVPEKFNGPCMVISWAKLNGIVYRRQTCVVVKFAETDDKLPIFGCIDKVLQNEGGEILLVCRLLVTYGFSSHFHAYDVEFSTYLECVCVDDLVSPFPVILHRMGDGTLYTTPRHKL